MPVQDTTQRVLSKFVYHVLLMQLIVQPEKLGVTKP